MHGGFCDQPWPGNDAGDDPGLSRTVGSGDTRPHGSYRAPARCSALSGFLSAIREIIFRCFAEEEKNQQNAKQNAEIREFSVKTPKNNVLRSS